MTKTKGTYLAVIAVLLSPMAANAGLIHDFTVTTDDGNIDLIGVIEFSEESSGFFNTNGFIIGNATVDFLFTGGTMWGHSVLDFEILDFQFSGVVDAVTWQINNLFMSSSFITVQGVPGIPNSTTGELLFPHFNLFTGALDFGSECTAIDLGGTFCNGTFTGITGPTTTVVTHRTAVVPEPSTLALFGIGLFGMGLARRRRKT